MLLLQEVWPHDSIMPLQASQGQCQRVKNDSRSNLSPRPQLSPSLSKQQNQKVNGALLFPTLQLTANTLMPSDPEISKRTKLLGDLIENEKRLNHLTNRQLMPPLKK